MSTPFTLLALVFVLLAGLILAWQYYRRRVAQAGQSLDEILDDSRHLLALVVNLQQHRGMSSAWLSGDAAFLPRLRDKQRQIEALFQPLLQAARVEALRHAACYTGNDITLFAYRWRSLLESLAQKTPEQSIAEHSYLIGQALDWLAALGEARIEPKAGRCGQLGLARNYAYRLPALSEALGQARAVGSGVAARQACSPVARVRLMFLIGRAEALLEQAIQANDGGRHTSDTRNCLQQLSRTVRTSMLLNDGVRVTPETYFSTATRAIDAVIAWIDASGEQLHALSGPVVAIEPGLRAAG